MNGEPLIEHPSISIRFDEMAKKIRHNEAPNLSIGACVIVPPGGGDPIEFLLIDSKSDLAQFYSAIMTKIQVQLEEMKNQQQRGWGR